MLKDKTIVFDESAKKNILELRFGIGEGKYELCNRRNKFFYKEVLL